MVNVYYCTVSQAFIFLTVKDRSVYFSFTRLSLLVCCSLSYSCLKHFNPDGNGPECFLSGLQSAGPIIFYLFLIVTLTLQIWGRDILPPTWIFLYNFLTVNGRVLKFCKFFYNFFRRHVPKIDALCQLHPCLNAAWQCLISFLSDISSLYQAFSTKKVVKNWKIWIQAVFKY